MFPTVSQAKALLEEAVNLSRRGEFPLDSASEQAWFLHSEKVAEIAAFIAGRISHLDPEKAWVMGYLHDCGRFRDEWNEPYFHGLEGYHFLLHKGFDEPARIALTHSFYDFEFNLPTYHRIPKQIIPEIRRLFYALPQDDYDILIQLCDVLNDLGHNCTIEQRFDSLANRYPINQAYTDHALNILNRRKQYFENLIDADLYKMMGLNPQTFNQTTVSKEDK